MGKKEERDHLLHPLGCNSDWNYAVSLEEQLSGHWVPLGAPLTTVPHPLQTFGGF